MKDLLIVRHGNYGRNYHLDEVGREQIAKMAKWIRMLSELGSLALLSSTAPRAIESAEIIGKEIGVQIHEHPILWSGGDAIFGDERERWSSEGVVALIRQYEQYDTVILVCHLESTESVPERFGDRVLGVHTFPYKEVGKGEGWLIDCKLKTCTKIQP